jgi:hypothetical protein
MPNSDYLNAVKDYLCSDKFVQDTKEINAHKERDFDDKTLFILWAYCQELLGFNGLLSCFDLTRDEYAFCMGKIFGLKSREYFLKTANVNWQGEETLKSKSINLRNAIRIEATYKRRGCHFVDSIDKLKTTYEKKYLDLRGYLREEYKEFAKKLLEKGESNERI